VRIVGSTPVAPSTARSATAMVVTGTSILSGVGQTSQLTALATLSDSTTQNVTASASWGSSNTAAAVVSNTGL
jgi:hypothetical protein